MFLPVFVQHLQKDGIVSPAAPKLHVLHHEGEVLRVVGLTAHALAMDDIPIDDAVAMLALRLGIL